MPHHLMIYTESIAQNVEVDVDALADGIVTISNNHFQPLERLKLAFACAASANVARVRVSTPSIQRYTSPFIRPLSNAVGWGVPQRVQDFRNLGFSLPALEEITVTALQTGAGAERVWVGVGAMIQDRPAPAGPVYTLRGASTTAAVANVITPISVTWQNQLPAGQYAIVGCQVQSATGLFFRLNIQGFAYRPGGASLTTIGSDPHELFLPNGLGEWGRFSNTAMPSLEVLCNAADALHEIYLQVVPLMSA